MLMQKDDFYDYFMRIANTLCDKRETTVEKMVATYWEALRDFDRDILYNVLIDSASMDETLPKPHEYRLRCFTRKEERNQTHGEHEDDPMYGRRPQDLKAYREFLMTLAETAENGGFVKYSGGLKDMGYCNMRGAFGLTAEGIIERAKNFEEAEKRRRDRLDV